MKNKRVLIISISIILTIALIYGVFSYNNKSTDSKVPETFAIYIEETPGNFVLSSANSWPTEHLFDSSKSYCKLGSSLAWNGADNSVVMTSGGADECYIYFRLPPDIAITSMTLDDNPITSYPAKSNNLMVDVTCTNAEGKWDYKYWDFSITNITGKSQCSLEFIADTTPTTIANHIIGLDAAGNAEIEYTNNAEYRYTGLNPDNYIWFNDEMWRVIGVFNQASHGVTGQNIVKIIREDSFTYVFDTGKDNSWSDSGGGATLNTLYNTYFYNGTDGTSYAGCRVNGSTISGNCDFTEKGLDASDRSLVQNATWYLGGFSSSSITVSGAYTAERGSATSDGTNLTHSAPIGLMYASDYGYAAPSSCYSMNIENYSFSCGGANWLLSNQQEWTIVPYSSNSFYVWIVGYSGSVNNFFANSGSESRPVLYLQSNTLHLDGTGTESDPFIVG